MIVDQHAAHERILFNDLAPGRAEMQQMLVPHLLHLSPPQMAGVAGALDDLSEAGLVLEEFGGGTARVVAHAAALPADRVGEAAAEVVDGILAGGHEADPGRRREKVRATIACHAAVKFGQVLGREEMESLLRRLPR